jgi:hypothetical protein
MAQPNLFNFNANKYHKIQIKLDCGEIGIYRSWIMALFLLEDRDFKGFSSLFSSPVGPVKYTVIKFFGKIWLSGTLIILSWNQKCDGRTDGHEDPYIPPTLVERVYNKTECI